MWAIPTGVSWFLKKKKKSPSLESRTPNSVRIRQLGRTGIRGVTWTYISTYAYNKLIFIRDSRMSYRTYSYADLILIQISRMLYLAYTYNRLIFIRDSSRSYRIYPYSELILITDLCLFRTPVGVTELIVIQNLYLKHTYVYSGLS